MSPNPKRRTSLARWLGRRSIATRLFLSAAFWSSLILVIAGIVLSAIYRQTSEQDFDGRLGVYLRALVAELASSSEDGRAELGQLGEPLFDLPLSGWYWQVSRLDTPTPDIRVSNSLFTERLPRLADAGVEAGIGGARRAYATGPDDRRLRIVERLIDAGEQGRFLVQVAATPDDVERDITRFEIALGLTFSLLSLLLVGSTALQVRFGLRPLRRLQGGVAAIRRGDGERIMGSFPRDIAPLASELNLLIASNREIVERARTHVGNLAHALKTPLSVILNEADAERVEGDTLATKVREQAGVMRDQVNYHLDRARAAARSSVIGSVTDVKPVLDGLIRTFEKIYRDRHLAFAAEMAPSLRFRGERQDLEEMVGNLIDNAGKWAAARVAVTVRVAHDGGDVEAGIAVVVEDDGPGLTPEERTLVTRRGRRMDETKPGSGLGLSIVTDLAGIYGGRFTLDTSPLGGLRATLLLP